jgi:hypothetical protein
MLQKFEFESAAVRVVTGADGDPWFNANDVCSALELGNPRQALDSHVDFEDVQKLDTPTPGGNQLASFVNESGMYALILGSTKDSAKRFKRWVTSEVLPSIRKTGAYAAPGATGDLFPRHHSALVDTLAHAVNRGLLSRRGALARFDAALGLKPARATTSLTVAAAAPMAAVLPPAATKAPAKPKNRPKAPPSISLRSPRPPPGFDGLNFVLSEAGGYVIGGPAVLRHVMLARGFITDAGGPTAKGRALVSHKGPQGHHWRLGDLFRALGAP